jgi:hypothetical protein
MSKRLTICVVISLAAHLWVAYLLEERFAHTEPTKTLGLTYRIITRQTAATAPNPNDRPLAGTEAPRTEVANPSDLSEDVGPYPGNDAYVSPDQVDELATATNVPELPLPTTPVANQGTAVLIIYVGADGMPEFVEVEQSTLPEDYTGLLALHFQMARFKPAMLFGSPVSSWRRIEVGLEEIGSHEHSENKAKTR